MVKVPYLLHEDPMALLGNGNHPRIKCEKTQINNSLESILNEDGCGCYVKFEVKSLFNILNLVCYYPKIKPPPSLIS